jgi:hypothetical protein
MQQRALRAQDLQIISDFEALTVNIVGNYPF